MIKELVKKLNSLKIHQTSGEFEEDLPEDIYEKYFENAKQVALLDIDKHRWYETAFIVYNLPNIGKIGVKTVTQMYSEESSIEDVYHTLMFFEVEEIQITSYKAIK